MIEENKKSEFKSFLDKSFSSVMNNLSSYYKSEVNIESIKFFRINNENDFELKNKEVYSNFFHQDAYLFTYIKIFVNLNLQSFHLFFSLFLLILIILHKFLNFALQ